MRSIPAPLLNHKRNSSTSLCHLIKIRSKSGIVVGMTNLNKDVIYDDNTGDGEIKYHASIGFENASILSSATMGVDNTEFEGLVPIFDFPLNEVDVNAGRWDYAEFWIREVNYLDLNDGHWTVMHGSLGETKIHNGTLLWGELRSITDQLKQQACQLYSLSCRAKFGDAQCGFDAESLWITGAITEVGAESDRVFIDSSMVHPEGFFEPGKVEFLSGRNEGRQLDIETYTIQKNDLDEDVGFISFKIPAPYNFEVGDTYKIRRDCNKRARDNEKGCSHWYGNQWGLHFRGEPDIPLGEGGSTSTPGGQVQTNTGGVDTSQQEE